MLFDCVYAPLRRAVIAAIASGHDQMGDSRIETADRRATEGSAINGKEALGFAVTGHASPADTQSDFRSPSRTCVERITRKFCGHAVQRMKPNNGYRADIIGAPEGIRTPDLCLRRAKDPTSLEIAGGRPAFLSLGFFGTIID